MGLLLDMFFDDSSSDDDDDDFVMVAILLTAIAIDQRPKRRGSVPRRKVVRRKLFDDYFPEDGSKAMVCASSTRGEDGVPVMNLSTGEAPMARRQMRKTRMKAELNEVHAVRNSAEEEARTEDRLDPSGPTTRREGKAQSKVPWPRVGAYIYRRRKNKISGDHRLHQDLGL